jgi:hypothetical protein
MFLDDEEVKTPAIAPEVYAEESEESEWQNVDLLAKVADGEKQAATAQAVAAPEFSLGDMLAPAIQTTFGVLAPNWDVTTEESAALGSAWGAVIEVWFPDASLSPKYVALGTALSITAMVVAPRMSKPAKAEKEVKSEAS